MAREKPNYRDMLMRYKEQGIADLVPQKTAMELLGVGHSKFSRLKKEGYINLKTGMVPIGDIVRLTC
jgi:hypothetical protein